MGCTEYPNPCEYAECSHGGAMRAHIGYSHGTQYSHSQRGSSGAHGYCEYALRSTPNLLCPDRTP